MSVIFVGGTIPSCVYTDTKVDLTNTTTHTFNAVAIGTTPASGKRLVVVTVYASGPLTAVTINGSGTLTVGHASNNPSMWQASVPTGTTATVVVTQGSAGAITAINVLAVYDLSSNTARASVADFSSPTALSLLVPARGVAIGFASTLISGATYTWTGATVDNTNTSGVNNFPRSVAHIVSPAGGNPLALSCAFSSSSTPRGLSASWR